MAVVPPISAVIVSFESSEVLGSCLEALPAAGARHGVEAWVIDNASTDDSVAVARRYLPAERVIQLPVNRGFSAGVNTGLARSTGRMVAVLNPDTVASPGSLDTLADLLARTPRAGLVAPLVVDPSGTPEASVGLFPTPARERNHALKLDKLTRAPGRTCPFPDQTGPVDWASGCAWLLRSEAVREVGPLDERFFMYFDDVDYCRRMWSSGWQVLATRTAQVEHRAGHGSSATGALAAEGGMSPTRYFEKHFTAREAERARRWLMRGWQLRAMAHQVANWFGRPDAAARAARYRQALARTRGAQ